MLVGGCFSKKENKLYAKELGRLEHFADFQHAAEVAKEAGMTEKAEAYRRLHGLSST